LDVFSYIRHLDQEDLSEATIRYSVVGIKKVFNCLIDEAQVYYGVSPVPRKLKIPKKGGIVRDRLASKEEIQAILTAEKAPQKGMYISPIHEVVSFLIYTGARLGEVLHAEWDDFDLEKGIWYIRKKPQCPTKECLGWVPKHHKERTVVLFPEALALLKSLPKRKTTGNVLERDESLKLLNSQNYPAKFVFPKGEIHRVGKSSQILFTRLDNPQNSWKVLKKRVNIQNLQLKDLRTYFNHTLKNRFGFTSKEAGLYVGNTEKINDLHYTPVSEEQIREKISRSSLFV